MAEPKQGYILKDRIHNLFNRLQKLCEIVKLFHLIFKVLESIGGRNSMKVIIIEVLVHNYYNNNNNNNKTNNIKQKQIKHDDGNNKNNIVIGILCI